MVIAFFSSPSGMRGGDRASAVGGVGGDWGVGEKMCANTARTSDNLVLTHPPMAGGVFSCPLNVGIPQAEPKSTRQFQLRWSSLSREIVADTRQTKEANKKQTADAVCFLLAPPAGLEPATT